MSDKNLVTFSNSLFIIFAQHRFNSCGKECTVRVKWINPLCLRFATKLVRGETPLPRLVGLSCLIMVCYLLLQGLSAAQSPTPTPTATPMSDDHGNSADTATVIAMDTEVQGDIEI